MGSLFNNNDNNDDDDNSCLDLSVLDSTQVSFLSEQCILVDKDDNILGSATKKYCHLLKNINNGMIHRAFSVLLFDSSSGKLLIQKRAESKITFPSQWTNTCCSHPRYTSIEMNGIQGAAVAAARKINHELGIVSRPEEYSFIARILYRGNSNSSIWGEQELDYIFIALCETQPQVAINHNEVEEILYVSQAELKELLRNPNYTFTPWFKLLANHFLLDKWWNNIEQSKIIPTETNVIHNFLQ